MKLFEYVLRRFGYVKMERFGLTLADDGRLLDLRGQDVAGPTELPVPLGVPSFVDPADESVSTHKVEKAQEKAQAEARAEAERDQAEQGEWERALQAARSRAELARPTPPHRTQTTRAARTTGSLAPQFERARSNLAH